MATIDGERAGINPLHRGSVTRRSQSRALEPVSSIAQQTNRQTDTRRAMKRYRLRICGRVNWTPNYTVWQKKHFSVMNKSFNAHCNLTTFSTLIVNEYYR